MNQQVERSKMEQDYQSQMAALSEELNRVRQELTSRTETMGQEMERWRQAAEATSRCFCTSSLCLIYPFFLLFTGLLGYK